MDIFRNLPNIITMARLCLVPLSMVFISSQEWMGAFIVFVCAGLSDALDGWLAKHFHLETELGAYLDPLADKALLIAIYVALAFSKEMPAALTILVVSRDLIIISAVFVSFALAKPLEIRPLFVSKLNTAAQIAFAGMVLASKAFMFDNGIWFTTGWILVAALTLASGAAYLLQWLRHMSN